MSDMADNRRMTTDRFYGGVTHRLQNLRTMLKFIETENPSRDQLNQWVISNTKANSHDAVGHHLSFLDAIGIIYLSNDQCRLAENGQRWNDEQAPEILYSALSSEVKGFDTILERLRSGPMTDEDIMDLLVSKFEEAEMTKPGPAVRHREWLQVLGYVEREEGINRLTAKGKEIMNGNKRSSGQIPFRPPPSLSIGGSYKQDEIEEAFDTGFGYQISGINPRRDDQDRRFVLVFANEDGPYDDDVTQGQFEYVGEGLSGDQSETSPGNSTLIDAINGGIPVHFFYKPSGGAEWEYQGLVDVQDYETRVEDDQDVLVFTMEHRSSSDGDQTTASEELSWLEAMRLELERYQDETGDIIVTLHEIYEFSERRLAARFPDNDHVRAKIRQQLQRLRDEDEVEFLNERGTYRIKVGDEIEQEKSDLEKALDEDPDLTDDSEDYTETRRRARDHAFAELVKDAYDDTCAICGSSRESPRGQAEVEAAHIYPKREGGADDVRNGITLCKLHHWAFDVGWISISDDYRILVKDSPSMDGFYEFKQREDDQLILPEKSEAKPHTKFLQNHRSINGF